MNIYRYFDNYLELELFECFVDCTKKIKEYINTLIFKNQFKYNDINNIFSNILEEKYHLEKYFHPDFIIEYKSLLQGFSYDKYTILKNSINFFNSDIDIIDKYFLCQKLEVTILYVSYAFKDFIKKNFINIFKLSLVIKIRKSNIIKTCWKRCISNPNYIICKKRLLREYKTLMDLK